MVYYIYMSVKRVPSTMLIQKSVVSSNNISNSSSKVVVSKLSIINEIKDTHQNLIKELLRLDRMKILSVLLIVLQIFKSIF